MGRLTAAFRTRPVSHVSKNSSFTIPGFSVTVRTSSPNKQRSLISRENTPDYLHCASVLLQCKSGYPD